MTQLVAREDIDKLVNNWRDLYERRMYNLAQFELESAVRRAPDEAVLHFLLGQTHLAQNRGSSARESIEKAERLMQGRATHVMFPQLRQNLSEALGSISRRMKETTMPVAPTSPFQWLEDPSSAANCPNSIAPKVPENASVDALAEAMEASARAVNAKLAELDRQIEADVQELLHKGVYNPGLGDKPVTFSSPRPAPIKDPKSFAPAPAMPKKIEYAGLPPAPALPSAADLMKAPPMPPLPEIAKIDLPPRPEMPSINIPMPPKPEGPRFEAPPPSLAAAPQTTVAAPQRTAEPIKPTQPQRTAAPIRQAEPTRPAAPTQTTQPNRSDTPQRPAVTPWQPAQQPTVSASPPLARVEPPKPVLAPPQPAVQQPAAKAVDPIERAISTAETKAKEAVNRAEDAWKSWETALTNKINDKKFDDALRQVETALVRHNDSLFLQEWKAKVQELRGDTDAAIRTYSEAMRNAASRGANEELQRFLERARQLGKSNGDRLAFVASALITAGLATQAVPFLREAGQAYKAVNNQPGLSVVLSQLRRLGRQDDAAALEGGAAPLRVDLNDIPGNLGDIVRQAGGARRNQQANARPEEVAPSPFENTTATRGMPTTTPVPSQSPTAGVGSMIGGMLMLFLGFVSAVNGVFIVPLILFFIANSMRETMSTTKGGEKAENFLKAVVVAQVVFGLIAIIVG